MKLTRDEWLKLPPEVRKRIVAANPGTFDASGRVALPSTPPPAASDLGDYDSKLERDFHAFLQESGFFDSVLHHPVRLRIAKGKRKAWYTPDFMAVHERMIELPDCRDVGVPEITMYEVKGFWREAARVRIKVAAGEYPMFKFIAATRVEGEWKFEEF
jgi:hypothetical protein